MLASRRQIQSDLTRFIRINSLYGFMLYAVDVAMYVVFIYGVLFLPELWMKVIASILAGFKVANLATIAHDAAHNSLTRSRGLNKFIAVTALLPGLMNYRLWVYNHHQLHHPLTNIDFSDQGPPDNYTPYSKEEFDALSPWEQFLQRLYRYPSIFVFGLYFIKERWSQVMFFPRDHMPENVQASAWRHFVLVMFFFTCLITLLVAAPAYSETGAITAFILGFAVPFYVFQSLIGFTVYVQHTHKKVAWFKTSNDRGDQQRDRRQEFISVQLAFPKWLVPFMQMHHAYDHGAHHVCPAIPCYRLEAAQERLNELLGDYAITQEFSFSWLYNTMRKCKLYDYDNHRWLDFEGNVTSGPTLVLDRYNQDRKAEKGVFSKEKMLRSAA